jgi:hypothetical protein
VSPELQAEIADYNRGREAAFEVMSAKHRDSQAGHHERASELAADIEARAMRLRLQRYKILGMFEREYLCK